MDSEGPTIDPKGSSSRRQEGSDPPSSRTGSTLGSSSLLGSSRRPLTPERGAFDSGEEVAGRYRIIGLLGKGGMGEVYRAHDNAIGQEVAIKFLPEEVSADPARAELFINELRLARQVTHPNVCRVHDIGEANGQLYLTMELIDGEPLSRVIKRLGRLPDERAVQVARQICGGLAAAHAQGIVHRDLKPSNIMIDDEGVPKVLDFGVAAVASHLAPEDITAGTPNYMAPEQLDGNSVTERSDLFSLGLIFYEMFTGRPAIRAKTLDELRRIHRRNPIADPAETGLSIDPSVERTVLACLHRDPLARPRSARIVSAMLPGSDPLADAIAAGETPSPELVAAAGGSQRLNPIIAALLLIVSLASIGLGVFLMERVGLVHRVPLEKPADVLSYDARRIIDSLGYESAGAYRAYSFDLYEEYLQEIAERDKSAQRWDRLSRPRPAPIDFWYRQSPRPISSLAPSGMISYDDPPPIVPGMISVRLDPTGRLRELIAVTSPGELPERAAEPDAAKLFEAAGLDIGAFERVEPGRVPQSYADRLGAWTGVYPESPEVAIRVEAAWLGGKPVAFRIIESEWPDASGVPIETRSRSHDLAETLEGLMLAMILVVGLVLSVQNLRRRRGDRAGAFKLAACVFVLELVGALLLSHHTAEMSALVGRWWMLAAFGCGQAALLWLLYIAIEPYARRIWPETLITWSRLLQGRWRDPSVAQGVLVGIALGGFAICAFSFMELSGTWLGQPPEMPMLDEESSIIALSGPSRVGGLIGTLAGDSVQFALVFLAGLVIVRLIIKNRGGSRRCCTPRSTRSSGRCTTST